MLHIFGPQFCPRFVVASIPNIDEDDNKTKHLLRPETEAQHEGQESRKQLAYKDEGKL